MADGRQDTPARDFFISRAGADKDLAASIGGILEAAGYSVLLQQWDFANANFMSEIHEGLKSNARVIALLSPDYLKSEHCLAEVLNKIGHDPLNKDRRLIAMRVAECTPDGLFTALAYWDLLPVLGDASMLREVVLAAAKTERLKQAPAHPSWRSPRAVLHPAIRAIPNFTGRREDLARLDAALWADRPADAAPAHVAAITQAQAAVHGLGGVGKSVLAAQYGWENCERYAGVWRLAAETEIGVTDGLIALGARFIPGLAEAQDRAAAAQAALDVIAGGGFEKPWLLIYDNVETPDALKGMTPRSGAHVLITTRWRNWNGKASPLPLGVFSPKEAVDFLLKAAGRADAEGAARLAEELGYLPVALDHAAAFCAETGDSFDAYRQRLAGWLKEAPEAADYPKAVFATFSLAIEKAAANCPEAETLMGLLAFMAPDDFPRDIVTEDAIGGLALSKATGALSRASLVTVKEQREGGPLLSVHRLVQHVMRGRLAERGDAEKTAATALRLVADAFPNPADDVRNWPACERLLPHAMTLPSAPESGDGADKTARLCNQTALYLMCRADYEAAEPLYRRALAIDEAAYGSDHPNVAIRLNNLAALLQDTNRLAEAEPLIRRALAIFENAYGPNHPNVATSLNTLALLFQAVNRLAEAEPLIRRALVIFENAYGPDHPYVATNLNNLAALFQAVNRLGEAEPLMRRALAIDEAAYGPSHPNVARDLNNLAQILKTTNRLGEAEPLMRRALAIDEAAYGPDHPLVAIRLNNLAQLLQDTNRLAEAEPLMRRALAIDEGAYGLGHPNVAIRLNNLAQLLKATGRLAEAEPPMRRALAIFEASLGADHPSTRTARGNLDALLAEMGGA